MRWAAILAAAATLVASEDGARCPAPRASATPTTVRFSEATVPPSPELSVRSTSRSSPRPTLEKMLTSRSFHTLQSSALDKLRRRKRGECNGDTSGKSDWCRETVFPELYFGGLVEALEEHMANGDLVFPEGTRK